MHTRQARTSSCGHRRFPPQRVHAQRHAVPAQGFNLEALDGYLSALVVSPGPEIAFAEWKPAVWGEAPRWDAAR